MAAGIHVGLDCVLARNTGNYAVPTWVSVNIVVDTTHNLEIDTAEIKYRASTWVKEAVLHKKGPVSVKLIKDTSDTNYTALRDAAIGRTIVDLAIADGPIATSGTEYFRSEFVIKKFANGQPIDGVNTTDMELGIAATANDPAFTTVGS